MKKFSLTLAVIGVVNFAAFAASSMANGGGASAGKVENGVYYLGNHGKYSPVSQEVYQRILWHERSVWVTHPLAILGFILYGAARVTEKAREGGPGSTR